ncbi:MBL fold metallo-hydrolase [bacterium]|nr:MBL fold metallo-hydrolase [bacterium]
MHVRLLPSSCGSPDPGPQFLSSYLVGDAIVIDGGSVGLQADLAIQRGVRHVFLTHAHLDHVASLPLLVENTHEPGPDCIELLASAGTLAEVRRDFFNGRVWPDFVGLSSARDRFLSETVLEPLAPVDRAGHRITPVPVAHGVDTLAMVVDDGRACVAFAADTGPTDLLWNHLADRPNVRGVFLECSFPESLAGLAARCGHLAPATFAEQVGRLPAGVRTLVVHRKAAHAETIAAEITALGLADVELAVPGRRYEF